MGVGGDTKQLLHFDGPVVLDLDVLRLQIAVDDPLLMGSFQGFGDLLGDGEHLVDRDRPLLDAIGQRRPFDQFQDQCLLALGFLQPVDVPDVGMVQRGQDFGFTFKPSEAIRIIREGLGQIG